jgi:hypothetical protein
MFGHRRAAFALVQACVRTFGLAGLVAPVRAQTLADVARKEEERRRAVSQPGKVYTNKDLRPAPSSAPPPAAAEQKSDQKAAPEKDAGRSEKSGTKAEAAGKDANAAADGAKQPVKDRAYWSGRLKALQEQLERDQTYADALQSRINALFTDFINRDDPVQKGAIERDRLRAIAELDRLKQAIPNDKKAIDNLLEDARRAGVPPGWLR